MARIEPVRKAAVLEGGNKPTHLRQGGGILFVAQVAPLRQPCLETDLYRLGRLTLGPASYPQPGCQLTGCGHQRKPVDGTANLITRPRRCQHIGEVLDVVDQLRPVLILVCGQCFDESAKYSAMLPQRVGLQGVSKGATVLHAMQALKRTMLPGVARDLDGAHLHPRLGTLPGTGGMVLETQLTGRQEQQPPGFTLSQLPILLAAALALAVGQHVGGLSCFPAVQLAQFIQTEQGIIALAGDPLDGVTGGPPGLGVAVRVTVDAGGSFHHRGFAIGTLTLEVKSTAFHSHQ
ncbi:hypothetical protein D3C84_444490 [compost metagenome]